MNERFSIVVVLSVLCVAGCANRAPLANDRAQNLADRAAQAFLDEEYKKARSLSEEAVRLRPDFAEAWVLHGKSCVLEGDAASARESYERALRLHAQRYRMNSDDTSQLVQQVYILLLLGRDAEARALLAQGLEAHPADERLTLLSSGMDNLLADGEFHRLCVEQP